MSIFNDQLGVNLSTTVNSAVIDTGAMGSVGCQITGSWVGTLVFEFTIDGVTWNPLSDQYGASLATQTTTNGVFQFNVSAVKAVRVRGNPLTSGTPIVSLHADEMTGAGVGLSQLAAPYAPSPFANYGSSTAFTLSTLMTAKILSFVATNINSAVRYLQLYNTNQSANLTGLVPVFSFEIPGGTAAVPGQTTIGRDVFSQDGVNFPSGLTIAISTTQASYTAATNTDHSVQGTYTTGSFIVTANLISLTDFTAPADSAFIMTNDMILQTDFTAPADSAIIMSTSMLAPVDFTAPNDPFSIYSTSMLSLSDFSAPDDTQFSIVPLAARSILASDSSAPGDNLFTIVSLSYIPGSAATDFTAPSDVAIVVANMALSLSEGSGPTDTLTIFSSSYIPVTDASGPSDSIQIIVNSFINVTDFSAPADQITVTHT